MFTIPSARGASRRWGGVRSSGAPNSRGKVSVVCWLWLACLQLPLPACLLFAMTSMLTITSMVTITSMFTIISMLTVTSMFYSFYYLLLQVRLTVTCMSTSTIISMLTITSMFCYFYYVLLLVCFTITRMSTTTGSRRWGRALSSGEPTPRENVLASVTRPAKITTQTLYY